MQIDRVVIHPDWTGDCVHGNNLALLHVAQSPSTFAEPTHQPSYKWMKGLEQQRIDRELLQVPPPAVILDSVLAAPDFNAHPNMMVYGFRVQDARLEMAQFQVVANHLCPRVRISGHGMFCVFSPWAGAHVGTSSLEGKGGDRR